MNKENKEIIKQEEASTQKKKKSRKELYKEFGKKLRIHQFVWVSSSLGCTPYPCSA